MNGTISTAAVELFITASMPSWLREGAAVPPTWDGPSEEWKRLQSEARREWIVTATFRFAESIAAKGYYPDELVRGQLRPGAEVILASGIVRRPMPAMHQELRARADAALSGLRSQNLGDGLGMAVLEEIARGRAGTDRRRALNAIETAERALEAAHAEAREAAAEREARQSIEVLVPFTSSGGKRWQPGNCSLEEEAYRALVDWRAKQEAFAAMHGWELPEGFAVWPPFIPSPRHFQ